MNIKRIKQGVISRSMKVINNRRGWTTDRRIIVIESDDWGSVRMPSTYALNTLLSKGVKLHPEGGYDKLDTLASNQDLEMLIDVLSSVYDSNNNPAKITLNFIMANPDFDKIKKSEFTEYHYEIFTETLKRYPNHDKVFSLLNKGKDLKVFQPQFHGREHVNVEMWMNALRKKYPGVREAFNFGVFYNHITPSKSDKRYRFNETYNVIKKEEYKTIIKSIKEGLNIFEKVFGFKSESMIAPTYLWDQIVEDISFEKGVRVIQGNRIQKHSEYNKNITNKYRSFRYIGEKNSNNQVYLVRNCMFEPSQNPIYGYDRCLNDIRTAFRRNRPAIISSHRVNFIGELHKENRDNNLKLLKSLLNQIIIEYPDIEFMSSDELGNLILSQ